MDRNREAPRGADRLAWWTASAKSIPNAKLVYNNSPSFNWTLNFRQQVYDAWMTAAGKDVSAYDRAKLMSVDYDTTELAKDADERIRTFQADGAQAGPASSTT